MIMKTLAVALLALAAPTALAFAEGPSELEGDNERLSYSFGVNFARTLRAQQIEIDPDLYVQGFRDAYAGSETLLTDNEVRAEIAAFQQRLAKRRHEKAEALAEKNRREGDAFLAENATRPGVETAADGLQYKVLAAGEGPLPGPLDVVTVHYESRRIDGTRFDSSYDRDRPARFRVREAIEGWTQALQMMQEGAKWRIFVPPALAYGEKGAGDTIGPYATLIYDLELVRVEKADTGWTAPGKPAFALSAPAGLRATVGGEGVHLRWKPAPDRPDVMTGYEVLRADFASGPFEAVGTVAREQHAFLDSSAAEERIYYYRVRSVAPGMRSEPSNTVAVEKAGRP